jgi:hypothetical protein
MATIAKIVDSPPFSKGRRGGRIGVPRKCTSANKPPAEGGSIWEVRVRQHLDEFGDDLQLSLISVVTSILRLQPYELQRVAC